MAVHDYNLPMSLESLANMHVYAPVQTPYSRRNTLGNIKLGLDEKEDGKTIYQLSLIHI